MSLRSGFMTLEDATAMKGSLHNLITEPDRHLGPAARLSPRIQRQRTTINGFMASSVPPTGPRAPARTFAQ